MMKKEIIYPDLSYQIMGAIFAVHKTLGPGFLEAMYQKALLHELSLRGLKGEVEKPYNIIYRGKKIGLYRLDLIVEDKVVIEVKTVDQFHPIHKFQVLAYLKATGLKLGILANFAKEKVEYERIILG